MTNHNALISDGSIGVAVRVPVSNQSLFSPGGGRYISIPRKKLVQKLEADPSQTRINHLDRSYESFFPNPNPTGKHFFPPGV
ncbi:putative trehalose-phosphate phosphatase D [Cardamine amara subsp. amara]|uniref:Trehalose-phosphate phosphatase D n=1 Tax=Cardamine amara subsp. amara TaxID=228776 RepID=A0ABD0ZLW3_CARAN